MPPDLLSGLQI